MPAAALLLLSQPGIRAPTAVAAMTTALGFTSVGLGGYVANMSDLAPRHAGELYGLCSSLGCWGGIAGSRGRHSGGVRCGGTTLLCARVPAHCGAVRGGHGCMASLVSRGRCFGVGLLVWLEGWELVGEGLGRRLEG